MTTRGKLIVFDGVDGAGKSTQIQRLAQWLEKCDVRVVITREPGGTPMAEGIRALFKQSWAETVDPVTEAMLMWAARRQHITQVIRPALERGDWVLCDRFIASTVAYQVHGRGLSMSTVIDPYVKPVLEDLWPDLTLILDMPPEVSLARMQGRGEAPDRIELEHQDFFRRVREGYRSYLGYDRSACLIDAARPVDAVATSIMQRAGRLLHFGPVSRPHAVGALSP